MKNEEPTWNHLQSVRKNAPLVHNITNYVVMNNTANALLALGASPVMAHAKEEVAEMASIASALVINIGTLSPPWVEAMELAMKTARKKSTPIVVDPVGAGATSYRTDTVKSLINSVSPDFIRGNASEISALRSADAKTRGVDSTRESHSALETARNLAEEYHCVVIVSGKTDYIITEQQTIPVYNGHEIMSRVTGMGCTATALVGAFAGILSNPADAAVSAMTVMGIAGEMAAEQSGGPGTFQSLFLDSLYRMNEEEIRERIKTEEPDA